MRNKGIFEFLIEDDNGEEVFKRAWESRVKTEENTFENRLKARNRLDILEYNADVSKRKSFYTPDEDEERRLVELIKNDDPNFDRENFEKFVESVYRKFVEAYCSNNISSLKRYIDINIIEYYRLKEYQNQMLKHKKHIDILKFNFVDFFGYHKEADLDIISVAVGVVCYKYTQNANNEIISGSDKASQNEVILLSFARKKDAKTIKSVKEYIDGKYTCPNCGAEIKTISNVCEHCNTALYNSTSSWIINHMEIL